MRQKRRSEENVIFRGEERSDENLSKKIEKDETASPSTPRLSIDAQTTTFDMEDIKKRKSHRYENYKDYLGHAHFSTH
jgi:hypothetical protein